MLRLGVCCLSAALISVSAGVTGCGAGPEAAQTDRIDHCLQRAGFDTRQGRFRVTHGPGAGETTKSIFVGPKLHPQLTLIVLTPGLIDSYFSTEQGHSELRITNSVIAEKNILIRPIPYGKSFPLSDVPGIDAIKRCAAA
jgi:hypothetical protein